MGVFRPPSSVWASRSFAVKTIRSMGLGLVEPDRIAAFDARPSRLRRENPGVEVHLDPPVDEEALAIAGAVRPRRSERRLVHALPEAPPRQRAGEAVTLETGGAHHAQGATD